jgi:hypothetical protein
MSRAMMRVSVGQPDAGNRVWLTDYCRVGTFAGPDLERSWVGKIRFPFWAF